MKTNWLLVAVLPGILGSLACAQVDLVKEMSGVPPVKASGLPRIQIDRAASLIVVSGDADPVGLQREEILKAVEVYWNRAATGSETVPARVLISGNINHRLGLVSLCATLASGLQFLGSPCTDALADVSVTLELKGRKTYTGAGHGKSYAGLYYPGDPKSTSFIRAVADAVRLAAQ